MAVNSKFLDVTTTGVTEVGFTGPIAYFIVTLISGGPVYLTADGSAPTVKGAGSYSVSAIGVPRQVKADSYSGVKAIAVATAVLEVFAVPAQ